MCTWLNSRCETSPVLWRYDAKCKWCRESERVNLVTSLHCLLVNVRGVYLALIHVTMLNLLWQLFWESLYISMRSRTIAAVYICAIFLFFFLMSRMHLLWPLKLVRCENQRTSGRVFQQRTLACSSEHPLHGRPVHMKQKGALVISGVMWKWQRNEKD